MPNTAHWLTPPRPGAYHIFPQSSTNKVIMELSSTSLEILILTSGLSPAECGIPPGGGNRFDRWEETWGIIDSMNIGALATWATYRSHLSDGTAQMIKAGESCLGATHVGCGPAASEKAGDDLPERTGRGTRNVWPCSLRDSR